MLNIGMEYLELAKEYNTPIDWIQRHINHMCKQELNKYQVRKELQNAKTLYDIENCLLKCIIRKDSGYIFDPELYRKTSLLQKKKKKKKRKKFIHPSTLT